MDGADLVGAAGPREVEEVDWTFGWRASTHPAKPGVHPQRQLYQTMEGRREVQGVDLLMYAVSQPMQEHVPLRRVVPLALGGQGAELNGVVRYRAITLSEFRQPPSSLLPGRRAVEDALHGFRECLERRAARVSIRPHRRTPKGRPPSQESEDKCHLRSFRGKRAWL